MDQVQTMENHGKSHTMDNILNSFFFAIKFKTFCVCLKLTFSLCLLLCHAYKVFPTQKKFLYNFCDFKSLFKSLIYMKSILVSGNRNQPFP